MKNYATEFSFLFSQVYNCSLLQVDAPDKYEYLYGLGNNVRKFLEIYVYFRYPHVEERTDHSFEKLLRKMLADDLYSYTLVSRVMNEYSHLAGSPERASRVLDKEEIIKAAQCVVNLVKKDEEQYNSLLMSIGADLQPHPN